MYILNLKILINKETNSIKQEKIFLPLATMKPPSTNTNSKVKVPKVVATTSVLPNAAMKRKRERAI